MRTTITTLFLILSWKSYSQDTIAYYNILMFSKGDDRLYVYNEKKLDSNELVNCTVKYFLDRTKVHFYIEKYENGYKTYSKCFYPNGKEKVIAYYNPNAKLNGSFTMFYKNGNIEIDGQYINGKKTGIWIYKTIEGNLIKVENYYNDKIRKKDVKLKIESSICDIRDSLNFGCESNESQDLPRDIYLLDSNHLYIRSYQNEIILDLNYLTIGDSKDYLFTCKEDNNCILVNDSTLKNEINLTPYCFFEPNDIVNLFKNLLKEIKAQ